MKAAEIPKIDNSKHEAARLFNEQEVVETLNALDIMRRANMGDKTVDELIDWLMSVHEQNLEKRDKAA